MGGGVLAATGLTMDSLMAQQAAANMSQSLSNAQMANQQAAMNQRQASAINRGVRGVDTRTVSSTAASRVQKADWELEYDRKGREVDEMIERQRQERERVRIEEEIGNDPRGED